MSLFHTELPPEPQGWKIDPQPDWKGIAAKLDEPEEPVSALARNGILSYAGGSAHGCCTKHKVPLIHTITESVLCAVCECQRAEDNRNECEGLKKQLAEQQPPGLKAALERVQEAVRLSRRRLFVESERFEVQVDGRWIEAREIDLVVGYFPQDQRVQALEALAWLETNAWAQPSKERFAAIRAALEAT